MPVTQRQLATLLGLSQATVSLALRGESSIPLATRERILLAAQEHGYFPNPQVSSLMRQVRAGEASGEHGCLALIADAKSEADWLNHPAYHQQYEALQTRAALRGYRTECFFLEERGMTSARLNKILTARGIIGIVLMAPKRDTPTTLAFEWNRFAVVTSGYTWATPAVDRITPHYRQHMEVAIQRLQTLGCKRIGFLLGDHTRHRVDKNWLVGWLLHEIEQPKKTRVPRFSLNKDAARIPAFRRWLKRWKVDGLLIQSSGEALMAHQWLTKEGHDLPTLCLFHDKSLPPEIDAIDERNDLIGATLCDHLIAKLHHGELGLPTHPKLTMIPGGLHLAKRPRKPGSQG